MKKLSPMASFSNTFLQELRRPTAEDFQISCHIRQITNSLIILTVPNFPIMVLTGFSSVCVSKLWKREILNWKRSKKLPSARFDCEANADKHWWKKGFLAFQAFNLNRGSRKQLKNFDERPHLLVP